MIKDSINKKQIIPSKKPPRFNRRFFISTTILGGIISQLPYSKLFSGVPVQSGLLNDTEFQILHSVQNILFPIDENGPGAKEIFAADYLLWALSDKRKDPEEIKYIVDGIGWVNETAIESYSKGYLVLNQEKKEVLIEQISSENWGESWLSVILSFIFEALLSEPNYGGNPDQIGWTWLNHTPGHPRPLKNQLYPQILDNFRQIGSDYKKTDASEK